MVSVSHAAAKYSAYFSAILTFVNAVLIAVLIRKSTEEWDEVDCDIDDFKALKAECVRQAWEVENETRWLMFAVNCVGAIAPALVIPLVLTYADIFAKQTHSSLVRLMTPCFIIAAFVQTFQAASEAGLHTTADWMARDFDLTSPDEILLKSLTLTFFVSRSLFLWLFAMDLFFLAVGSFCFGLLALKVHDLPQGWGALACVSGFLGIISFGFELARFGDWALFSELAAFVFLFQLFVLMPVWLIWGACLLSRFEVRENQMSLMGPAEAKADDGDIELSEQRDVSRL